MTIAIPPPAAAPVIDVWDVLADRLDPATFRPRMAAGSEWKHFPLRWGNDYVMVANPERDVHYELEPWTLELFPLLDGTRTVAELVVERLGEGGKVDPDAVAELVTSLREGEFLEPRAADTDEALERALGSASSAGAKARTFLKTLRVEWSGAERVVTALYRGGFRWCFLPPVAVAGVAVALGGLVAYAEVVRSHRFELGSSSPPLESLILIGLSLVLTVAHELGHALVQVRDGRRIGGAGFMIYYGSPTFFVDASDGLMMDRPVRILQSVAGPGSELVLAGIASIVIFAFPDWGGSPLLYRFATLNLLIILLNLMPLLELDGYWIFSDVIQVPDLRARSLGFVRNDLVHRVKDRRGLTLQEWGLTAYFLIGVVFTVVSLFVSIFFWRHIFGGLVTGLWDGGPGSRILLLALAFFLAGPLVRGAVDAGRSIWRRVRALGRRVRFRLEQPWRVEAAELIDALPAFEDLPVDLLNDLAGRVSHRTFRRGQAIFRQGDRASAFYVVRRGTVAIEETHPDTGATRTLSTLGRGDSFGELALLQTLPRSATARAATETELFEVDEGTFDHLLAGAIRAPAFGLTLQSMAELRELPAFAHLSSEGLGEVVRLGSWRTVAPGEEVVRQGEPGDAFYAIRSGRADVVRDGRVVDTSGPGEHFGETALLTDAPRNATVVAHTPMRVFRLSREGFDELLAGAFRRRVVLPPTPRDMEH